MLNDEKKASSVTSRHQPDRINGVFDLPQPGRVGGWAIDRADPDAHVIVEIRRDGRKIAELPATAYRPDLERGGIGTGRYGFSIELDRPIGPGMAFSLTAIARTADGAEGPLRPIGSTMLADDPDRRLAQETHLAIGRLAVALGSGTNDARLLSALERLETTQARLEAALAERPEATAAQSLPVGLKAAVGLALALGIAALVIGLRSLYLL